jgi:predicted transcriptional regulator YheO
MIFENLKHYIPIADGIAALLYPHAEIVIHDLKTQTVVHLANNISKRKIGSPSLLEFFEIDFDQPVIGPYEKLNWDGKKLKSISITIHGNNAKPIGLMCINLDVSLMSDVHSIIGAFINPDNLLSHPDEIFKDDWQEKINIFIHSWLREHNQTLNSLNRAEKQTLIEIIDQRGGFKGKNAANYVAGILGMGRATVYKYLKELKQG